MPDLIPFAVTGATGGLGGRVARRLAQRGVLQRLVVRDPGRAPDLPNTQVAQASFGDGVAMRAALSGVSTLLLVPSHEARDRVAQHRIAVGAARDAGVERIVYVSFIAAGPESTFTFARHHWATEEAVRASGLPYTFVRMSLYLDFVPTMVVDGSVIRGPAGDGRVAWVTRDDLADVIVEVLTSTGYESQTLDVTGPESLSMGETVAAITEVTGHRVTYEPETMEQARASRASYGVEDWELEGWITSYAAIATGELDIVSDTVERLTGHRAQSVPEYLRANPPVWPPSPA